MKQTIKQYHGIQVDLIQDNNMPVALEFNMARAGLRIKLELDGIDWMVFGAIPSLDQLSQEEHTHLFQCLKEVITQQIGGKCLFSVHPHEVDSVKKWGFLDIKPVFTEPVAFFRNLMVIHIEADRCKQRFARFQKQFDILKSNYQFVSDKEALKQRAQEASRLLIDNASWAGEDPKNRQVYGKEAMQARFAQSNIRVFAAVDSMTRQLDAMLRVYSFGQVHYLGDLVVRKERRGQGLAMQLMEQVFQALPAHHTIALIAGDDNLVELYRKLSFERVEEIAPVYLNPEAVLMSAAFPKGVFTEKYHQCFAIPEAPGSNR